MTPKSRHFRILPLFAAIFVAICLFPVDESLPADGNSCFFVDGRPICGREGEIAREKHAKMVANLVAQQVQTNTIRNVTYSTFKRFG